MESCDLLISHTTALLPDMTLRNDVAIAVDRGIILALDDNEEVFLATLEVRYQPRTRLDGTGKVAMPGLVDAHTHVCQQLLRGRITDEPPMIWARFLVPFESTLEPAEIICKAGEHLQAITRRAGIA